MIKKLLNKNNLIIVLVMISTVLIAIPNIVYAADVKLSDFLRDTISTWYYYVKNVCIAVMIVVLIILGVKAAISDIAEDKADFKRLIKYWVIGLIFLIMLEEIIYAIIYIEQYIVERLKELGMTIVGGNTTEQEISLYDSARTKAYEIKFTSGMLGTFMYMILVYYTFKFFVIYVKRYINVMILILISPIVAVVYTYRKVFDGKSGVMGKWFKELIYNVYIQVIHAGVYSVVVGFALNLSEDALSFIGAILTFVAFFAMSKFDSMIRKMFNLVGGSSKVKKRDIESIIKHPVQTFQNTKGYVTETLPQEIQAKAQDVASQLTPENITLKANQLKNKAIYDIKDTIAAVDGKRVKVTAEEVLREQEKIDRPNLVQKVFNTVQGLALGAASAAITGVENLVKKTKEKIKKVNEATKKAREELNQDFEIIKRFSKVLKFHAKRKLTEQRAKEGEEQPEEEKLQLAVINVADTPEQEVMELKDAIKESSDDMAAIVYEVQGPAVFIYPEFGSGYMGLTILASAGYEHRAVSKSNNKNKIIAFPKKQLAAIKAQDVEEDGKVVSIASAKKRYMLKRFNSASVLTITSSLNRRFIMNNEYLANLYQVGQMVEAGGLGVRGVAANSDVSFRKTSIKYNAKMQSSKNRKSTADITFGRYSAPEVREESLDNQEGKIISFKTVRERKEQSQNIMNTYKERVQDANWAVLESTVSDVKEIHNKRVLDNVQDVKQKTSTEIVLQQLTDMGQAVKINSGVYVAFSEKPIEQVVEEIQDNTNHTETIQSITDSAIIDAVIKFDIPLEQINFDTDLEVQDEILENLSEKGVISNTVKSDETEKEQVVEALKERKDKILNEGKLEYAKNVIQKTAAKVFVDAVDTGDKVADKVKDLGSQAYEKAKNNRFINNEVTKKVLEGSTVLGEIAQGAIGAETDRLRQKLSDQVKIAVNTSNEYIEEAKELYSITKDDFIRKGKQIQESADEFAVKVERKAEKAAKSVVSAVTGIGGEKKDKGNDDENIDNNEDTFTFDIRGEVVLEGTYSLNLSVLENRIGRKVFPNYMEITVEDAINIAGGLTENADSSAIPYFDRVKNNGYVFIPKKSDDDEEELIKKYKPIVEEEIKDYLIRNNISNVEALRKLVHKKSLVSKIKDKIEDSKVTTALIEVMIEKRIKEIKFIRDSLNKTIQDLQVVEKAKVEVKETENVQVDRDRQENGARNSQEESLDRAIRNLHLLSESNNPETDENNVAENENQDQNEILNNLLNQLEERKEKVSVSYRNDARQNVNRLEFDDNQGKRRAREEFMKDPDQMINKILGRF